MADIGINQEDYDKLVAKYKDNPSTIKAIKKEIDGWQQHFDKHPFQGESRDIRINKVGKSITFYKLNYGHEESLSKIPKECLEILKDPELFKKITEVEFDKKIVGEIETRKVIFLCAAGGRLIENSQIASYNLLVNDDAGTGKDYITRAVLEILPPETYIHKTRISPAVFTYWHSSDKEPWWTWDGKVFYPEDISENVLNSEVFKVMASAGSSAIITIKNEAVDKEIIGKPVLITTTATATPSPELTRRFVILNLDSSENQTREIMKRHAEYKKKGIVPEYDLRYTQAMEYLKRVKVIIPFADLISQHFPSKSVIMRTNFPRFLDYISASAGIHQFQRIANDAGFLIAEGQDYDIARICFLKLCSNKFMIPLTTNQKKILSEFEKEPDYFGSVSTLHANKMNFISLPALQTNLGILASYGILQTKKGEDTLHREVEVYSLSKSYNPNEKLELPTYQQLQDNLTIFNNFNSLNNFNNFNNPETRGDTKDTKDIKSIKSLNNPASELNLKVEKQVVKSYTCKSCGKGLATKEAEFKKGYAYCPECMPK